MLRRYRGLKSGFGVTSNAVNYEAFKLSLTFREAPAEESDAISSSPPSVNSSTLLVISASPVKSVYQSKSNKRF